MKQPLNLLIFWIFEKTHACHGTHYNPSSQDGDVMRSYLNIQTSNNNLENAQAGRAAGLPSIQHGTKQAVCFFSALSLASPAPSSFHCLKSTRPLFEPSLWMPYFLRAEPCLQTAQIVKPLKEQSILLLGLLVSVTHLDLKFISIPLAEAVHFQVCQSLSRSSLPKLGDVGKALKNC